MTIETTQKETAVLREQETRCLAVQQTADETIRNLEAAQKEAEAALEEAMRHGLRTGNNDSERDARHRLLEIDAELLSVRERKTLAASEVSRLGMELAATGSRLRELLKGEARRLSNKIEERLRADKKLRAALVESIALYYVAEGGGGAIAWGAHLEDMLPPPEDAELEAAVASAREQLGIV